jgi:hypothetical protein
MNLKKGVPKQIVDEIIASAHSNDVDCLLAELDDDDFWCELGEIIDDHEIVVLIWPGRLLAHLKGERAWEFMVVKGFRRLYGRNPAKYSITGILCPDNDFADFLADDIGQGKITGADISMLSLPTA